jgi:outer membrane receptor for ferric coprogen and ferric-rhodotorulic acid
VFRDWGQRQTGAYLSWRSQLTAALHVIGGARYSDYKLMHLVDLYDTNSGDLVASADSSFKTSDVWTPYGGLTYGLTKAISLYGSYADIFQPQGNYVTESGTALKPVTGKTYEVGAKGSWLQNTLSASVAAYKVQRKNAAVYQPAASGTFGALYCCYTSIQEIDSKGIDAEIVGQVLHGWQVSAGYTYNVLEADQVDNGTSYIPPSPKHLLKLWTMAQLPGAWSAARVGGGINAQSRTFVSGSAETYDTTGAPLGSVPYNFTQGSYAIFSVRGEYQIDSRWSLALNVNNLFDRSYYQTVGPSSNLNFYGEPRNFMVSLHGQL